MTPARRRKAERRPRSEKRPASCSADDQAFLLHLVDTVWGVAHEDESVPSSEWAERMIAGARLTFARPEAERRAKARGATPAIDFSRAFDELAAEQGWDYGSVEGVLKGFVESLSQDSQRVALDYARGVAKIENEENEDDG